MDPQNARELPDRLVAVTGQWAIFQDKGAEPFQGIRRVAIGSIASDKARWLELWWRHCLLSNTLACPLDDSTEDEIEAMRREIFLVRDLLECAIAYPRMPAHRANSTAPPVPN